MHIEKSYINSRDWLDKEYCNVTMVVKDDENSIQALFWKDNKGNYLDIYNFNNEDYLRENKIDYLVEVVDSKQRIIPLGVVDFIKRGYCYEEELSLRITDSDKLYLCEEILENIERAISIKYESIKFLNKCKDKKIVKIGLDK